MNAKSIQSHCKQRRNKSTQKNYGKAVSHSDLDSFTMIEEDILRTVAQHVYNRVVDKVSFKKA